MDIDNLQNLWDNDKPQNIQVPANLDQLKSANTPLQKIRKNIKKDFFMQIFALVFVGFIPFVVKNKLAPMIFMTYYLVYVLSIIISIFFIVKLYQFYKKITQANNSTKDNLYETYYNIRLYVELYKSFTYAIMPFGIIYLFLLPIGTKSEKLINIFKNAQHQEYYIYGAVSIIAIFMILVWIMTEAHTKMFYVKYAEEIKKTINELNEE